MRIFGLLLGACLGVVLLTWEVQADEVGIRGGEASCSTSYPVKAKCRVISRAPKPALEMLEDGLAYLLDIPLAILSPITCPIVAPIMDEIDSSPDRYYSSVRKKCP